MINIISATFAIVGYDDLTKSYTNVGTGFFINSIGQFVSAAHTFKKEDRKFFAILADKGYPIKGIYSEYAAIDQQLAPVHQDFYLGEVLGITDTPFFTLRSSINLKIDDLLEFNGFSSQPYIDGYGNTSGVTLDDLYDDIGDDEPNNFEYDLDGLITGENPPEESNYCCDGLELKGISLIKHSSITGKFKQQTFERLHELLNVPGVFTNGYRFILTNQHLQPEGLSGCPVIHNKVVVGMLISAKGAISSDYIIDKLKKVKMNLLPLTNE